MAREIAEWIAALIAVNVMRAVSQYADYVRQACASGADAIVMGAGLPLDLPDHRGRLPRRRADPDPVGRARRSGAAAQEVDAQGSPARRHRDRASAPCRRAPRRGQGRGSRPIRASISHAVLPGCHRSLYRELGIERGRSIPLIAAGGINSARDRYARCFALGASAVQLGTAVRRDRAKATRTTCSSEGAGRGRPEDIVTFMSVAGLPARAVRTPWLETYLEPQARTPAGQGRRRSSEHKCTLAWDCLIQCGFRDGVAKFGQYCSPPVIPAQAGIQSGGGRCDVRCWTPAFAGVTE
jgi:nitronate monooxygenase